jgi:hypothetical protein
MGGSKYLNIASPGTHLAMSPSFDDAGPRSRFLEYILDLIIREELYSEAR